MTVRTLLNRHLCVAVFCCLPVFSASVQAATPIEQRVQRLERILDNRVLIDLLQRIEGLQREMRELRGEIELQRNEIAGMEQRNRDLYIDTDRRLQDIENRASAAADQAQDLVVGAAGSATRPDATAASSRAGVTVAAAPQVAPQQPEASALIDNTASVDPAEKALFDGAYFDLVNGRYSAATTGFEKLMAEYPDSEYSPGALYWMGEAQYAQRQFASAREHFDQLLVLYPTDKKAPDARLKVGFVEQELGDVEAAKATLEGVVSRHPRTTAALLAQRRLDEIDP